MLELTKVTFGKKELSHICLPCAWTCWPFPCYPVYICCINRICYIP
jgi:hypothetical protein